jgi:threonylcarbamoyladenosine tRNA methylthiotransferase MtaB
LVLRVLKLVPELGRLRLSSIDPAEVDAELIRAMADPRMSPYLHLSLQAGDDMILKRMKRRHSRADVFALAERLRAVRPDIVFGGDMIAGFPTEDDAMHQNSLEFVETLPVTWLHVFPFSPRAGTPAAKMPQVDGAVAKARAKALREAGKRARAAHLQGRVGQTVEALFEATSLGRLADFSLVKCPTAPEAGTVERVRITGHDGDRLLGEISG